MTVLKKSVTGEKSLCALYKKRLLSTWCTRFRCFKCSEDIDQRDPIPFAVGPDARADTTDY